jgi:hypothetical protein
VLRWFLQMDENKSAELALLHRTHMLMFGQVKTGLGMHTLHLPPDHPARQRVIRMFDSLKVRLTFSFRFLYHLVCTLA